MPTHDIFVQETRLCYLLGSCFRLGGPVGLLSGAGAEDPFFHRVHHRPTRWTRHSCSGQRVILCCPGSAHWACKIASSLVGGWGDCKNQTGLCPRRGGKEIALRVDGALDKPWHARVSWTLHTTCSKCHACRLPLHLSTLLSVFHRTRIMAFTDAILAIVCTSCAVPLWANGTHNFNPVRLVPFVTSFFILVRLWYVEMEPQPLYRSSLCFFSPYPLFPPLFVAIETGINGISSSTDSP